MLVAAFTFVIIDANKAQAQSVFDIPKVNKLADHMDHVAANTDKISIIINTCASEFNENLDACVSFYERYDKHLSALINQSKNDIQKIMGFDSVP